MPCLITVIQHDDDVPLARFENWLAADGDIELRVVYGRTTPIPTEAGDALIVLGGEANAYATEKFPHLGPTRALMRTSMDEGLPVLGVCLGAQLLAVETGGRVTVGHPDGREVGPVDVTWEEGAATDPVLGPLATASTRVAELHSDAITELGPDATALGRSERYLQAFRVGSALGVQFHPEVAPEQVGAWTATYEDVDSEAVVRDLRAADGEIAPASQALAAAFVAEVRASAARRNSR